MPPPRQLLMRRPTLDDLPPIPPLPPNHHIRLARADDDAALAPLLSAVFGPDPAWTSDRVRAALLDAPDVDAVFVVTADGAPVATASARLPPDRFPGSGYVHWVAAHPAHRGQGLGRVATLAVLDRFVALGRHDAVLETDPPRLPAIRLYLALGFRPEPHDPDDEIRWRGIRAALDAHPPTRAPDHAP